MKINKINIKNMLESVGKCWSLLELLERWKGFFILANVKKYIVPEIF
jgi:hypothetical protein